ARGDRQQRLLLVGVQCAADGLLGLDEAVDDRVLSGIGGALGQERQQDRHDSSLPGRGCTGRHPAGCRPSAGQRSAAVRPSSAAYSLCPSSSALAASARCRRTYSAFPAGVSIATTPYPSGRTSYGLASMSSSRV